MELSEFKEAVISYVAGYVVKMVQKKIKCLQCLAALTTSKEKLPDLFVTWKTKGGLKLPSMGLLEDLPGNGEVYTQNAQRKRRWFTTRCWHFKGNRRNSADSLYRKWGLQ